MAPPSVAVFEHRSGWAAEYAIVEADLRNVLGVLALRIDHIGSTAVVGLPAKDVIDVQVTVQSLDDGIAERLLAAGFTVYEQPVRKDHLPPGFAPQDQDWLKLLFMQRPGERRANIHIRQAGMPNQRYPLLVRDFLRAEPLIAEAYGELKKRLGSALADPTTYPYVKDPVSDIIYLAAERWAVAAKWQLSSEAHYSGAERAGGASVL